VVAWLGLSALEAVLADGDGEVEGKREGERGTAASGDEMFAVNAGADECGGGATHRPCSAIGGGGSSSSGIANRRGRRSLQEQLQQQQQQQKVGSPARRSRSRDRRKKPGESS